VEVVKADDSLCVVTTEPQGDLQEGGDEMLDGQGLVELSLYQCGEGWVYPSEC
jgi:hypothetical protein